MIGYRSTLAGDDVYAASYTVTSTNSGVNTVHAGSCSNMFNGNTTFNSVVNIGNNVWSTAQMFLNCANFNQNITIPSSVNDCSYMLYNATNYGAHVFFEGNTSREISVLNLIGNTNNSLAKYLHYNNNINFNYNNLYGSTSITWTTITNGLYNETYNVYLYNNYAG